MRKLILQLFMCVGLCGIAQAQTYIGPYDGSNTPLVRADIWKRIPGLDKNGNILFDGVSASFITSTKIVQPGQATPSQLPITLTVAPQASFTDVAVSVASYTVSSVTSVVAPTNCINGTVFSYTPTNTKIQYMNGSLSIVDGGSATQAQVPLGNVQLTTADSNCTAPTVTFKWGVGSVTLTNAGLGIPRSMSITDSVSGAVIGYTTDTQTVQMTSIIGDSFVPKTWVGTSVAGLDSNGNVTAAVNTQGTVWGQTSGKFGYISPRGTYPAMPTYSFAYNNEDPFLYPNTALFGGHTDHDDAYLKVVGSPWSQGDSGGAVAAISDTIGDQGTARNGAGNDDGISLYVGTQITPFRIVAGSQATDNNDSINRTVTLQGTSITITPALSNTQLNLLKQWMRLYVNIDASGGNAAGGSYWVGYSGEIDSNAPFTPNVYFSYVSGWQQNTNSTVLNVVSDPNSRTPGWRTETDSSTVTTAPGSNSGDIFDSSSSVPTWTYTTPTVFIGGANKKFNMNQTVACLTTEKDTLTRQCEGNEIDLWNYKDDEVSAAKNRITGLTITYGGQRGAAGSYNLMLAGGTENDIVALPEWWTTMIQSDPLYIAPLQGPSLDTSAGNTKAVMASFAQSTNTGANSFSAFNYIRPTIWTERFASDGTGTDYTNETVNFGPQISADRRVIGTVQEHIAFNPQAYKNGIGLCGYNACSYIDSQGEFFGAGNISTGAGNAFNAMDPNGSVAGYIYASATNQIEIGFNNQTGTSAQTSGAQGSKNVNINGNISADNATFNDINPKGNINLLNGKSITMCDASGKCGYVVGSPNANMMLKSYNGLYGGGIVPALYTKANLPTVEDDGAELYCSDCVLNNVTGAKVIYHGSNNTWTYEDNSSIQ